jgi:hypothetical protein
MSGGGGYTYKPGLAFRMRLRFPQAGVNADPEARIS